MSIKALPQEVIDQISAGEVVERPAHMVKELVENAVDAGSSEIEVEFDLGGRFVRVTDNGNGIRREELALALSRHATSKISRTEDLWSLHSFGFRGEALASVASVSRLQLFSKFREANEDESAYEINSEFGRLSDVSERGGAYGTTVVVDELFRNTPARLKFLKSDGAESAQIKNVLKALAMAHPEVSFRVRHKNQMLFFWPAAENRLERVKEVLGQNEMYEEEFEYEGAKAKVILCAPHVTTGTSKQIWGFVQNRWVQDKTLQAAILDAYRNLLMHGEFPIAAYWLEMASDEVDVNIHPTKSQVKFRDSKVAFRAVNRASRTLLEKAPWLGDLIPDDIPEEALRPKKSGSESKVFTRPEVNGEFAGAAFDQVQFAQKPGVVLGETKVDLQSPVDQPEVVSASHESPVVGESSIDVSSVDDKAAVEGPPLMNTRQWSRLQVLGQADLTYIITQSDKGLMIIDQHAAHERVMFERLRNSWHEEKVEVQNFLLPLTVTLDEIQVEAVLEKAAELERLGICIESMGPKVIAVSGAPQSVSEKSIVKTLDKLGRELIEQGDSFAFEKSINEIIATMACHSAVRAGQALGMDQMKGLLEQMDEYPLSSFCPHGRPVFVEYTFAKLERDFGRTV